MVTGQWGAVEAADGRRARGGASEDRALAWLLARGLVLGQRNYRVARGPRARGGEIDLILRDRDRTLVFVEVCARRGAGHGGVAASVTSSKCQRPVRAAQQYLLRFAALPASRFGVVAIDGDRVDGLQAGLDAS